MADTKYKDYLAARILTESRPVSSTYTMESFFTADAFKVTYKLLSRALQVNVSVAKW